MSQRWYLSFATQEKFLGACLVEAGWFGSAVSAATARGLNPGGQVCGAACPDHVVAQCNVLWPTRADIEAAFGEPSVRVGDAEFGELGVSTGVPDPDSDEPTF